MQNIIKIVFQSGIILIIFANLLACSSTTLQKKQTTTGQQNIVKTKNHHKIFQPIIPELQKQTNIPLLLPTYVPESGTPNLQALIEKVNSSEYKIMLAFHEQCNGGTACRMGSVFGKSKNQINPDLDGIEVNLNQNIKGYFIDATCGANCSDSTLTWIANDNIYQVAIQGGKLDTLVEMANSAILTLSLTSKHI